MAMKRLPASAAPTACLTRSKKYCLKMLGSSVPPDLLDTMKIVFVEIDPAFDRLDLRRVGGIEHVQLREAGDLAEGHAHDLRTEARSAHAQQQRMFEPRRLDLLGDALQVLDVRQLVVGDAQPAQPVGFVGAGPQRGVAAPQPPHLLLLLPVIDGGADRVVAGRPAS